MKRKILLPAVLLGCAILLHAGSMEEMQGLELKHIKVPFYKDRKIQLLVFADNANRQDQLMVAGNTFLDMLLENANVDKIPDGWRIRPRINGAEIPEGCKELYPLGTSFKNVLEFWRDRHNISDAVIFSPKSFINQRQETVYGESPVFFRSPLFDLDGNGFSVKFKEQIVSISGNVRIVLRSSDMDPRRIITGAPVPAEERVVLATARELHIYQKENKIVLFGDVSVIDGRNRMTCRRLRIFLNDSDSKVADKRVSVSQDEKAVLDGISRVLADGDVKLYQFPEDPLKKYPTPATAADFGRITGHAATFARDFQKSTADHLEYDVKRGIIILTGDGKYPTLKRGLDVELTGKRIELLRHEDKIFVLKDCRIVSNAWDQKTRRPFKRWINSNRANFDGRTNVANFHGNVIAVDRNTTLTSDSLRIHLIRQQDKDNAIKIELVFASGNVKIVSRSEKESIPGKKIISHSTITSNRAELNYRKNELVFFGSVKVRDNSATLDCDRLDLTLADKTDTAEKKKNTGDISGAPLASGMEGQNKTLTKMIAKGDVKMTSDGDILETDMLTLFFRDLPPGEKPAPGMIQSGGVQLTRIHCDGTVRAVSYKNDRNGRQNIRKLQAAHAVSDLLKDESDFYGDVAMVDNDTEIHCQHMRIITGASPIRKNVEEKQQDTAAKHKPQEDDIDADPFAMEASENDAPRKVIAISDDRNLKRVICRKQVVLLRKDKKGNFHKAGGDMAVYTANTGEVVLTAQPPARPWLQGDGRKHFCDLIRSDINTGDLRGIGNVVVLPDEQ